MIQTPLPTQNHEATTVDAEIAAAAKLILDRSSVAELRRLRVDESEHELTLRGNVRSYYHKQLAQESVRDVAGQLQVINAVSVDASMCAVAE